MFVFSSVDKYTNYIVVKFLKSNSYYNKGGQVGVALLYSRL